jgi:hypothetical protein
MVEINDNQLGEMAYEYRCEVYCVKPEVDMQITEIVDKLGTTTCKC